MPDAPLMNGKRMVPAVCQECGVQIGWRTPGPVRDDVNLYCYDHAPLDIAEAAMRDRPTEGTK